MIKDKTLIADLCMKISISIRARKQKGKRFFKVKILIKFIRLIHLNIKFGFLQFLSFPNINLLLMQRRLDMLGKICLKG